MAALRPARVPGAAAAALLVCGTPGCESYESVLADFDALAPIAELRGDPDRTWSYRDPGADEEAHPAALARGSILALRDHAAGDLPRTAEVVGRLLWVADLDRSPLNRAMSLQVMTRLLEELDLGLLLLDTRRPAPVGESAQQLAALTEHVARRAELTDAERARLREALAWFGREPLALPRQRREVIPELLQLHREAADPELRDAAGEALRRAMEFAVYGSYVVILGDDDPSLVELRRAAVLELHRHGGADSLAWILELIQRPPDPTRGGLVGYDPSPWVLLDLVRLCGQLDPDRALRGYRDGPAPAEFLYEVISAPLLPDGLQMLALESLALCLRRPVSFDARWAEEWYREWTAGRVGRGAGR